MNGTVAFAIIIAAVGVGYAMNRASRIRKQLSEIADIETPKRQSKRQKRLEQIRAAEPE